MQAGGVKQKIQVWLSRSVSTLGLLVMLSFLLRYLGAGLRRNLCLWIPELLKWWVADLHPQGEVEVEVEFQFGGGGHKLFSQQREPAFTH
jgi:hypothetical protein